MPEGMSIESGLEGLKNIDGSDLSTGSNHFGVGEEAILDSRLNANSPFNVDRDPFAPSASGGTSSESGSAAPVGADLTSRSPKWDLVSGKQSGGLTITIGEPKIVPNPPEPKLTITIGEPRIVQDDTLDG